MPHSFKAQGLKFEDVCVRYARYYILKNHKDYGLIRSGWESYGRELNPISPLDFNKKKAKEIVNQLGLSSKMVGRMPDIAIVKWINTRKTKFVINSFIECKQGQDRRLVDGSTEHSVSVKNGQADLLKTITETGFKVHVLASSREGDWFYTVDFDHSLLKEVRTSPEYRVLAVEHSDSFRSHVNIFRAMEHITESLRPR